MWNRKLGTLTSLVLLAGCLLFGAVGATAEDATSNEDVKVRIHKKIIGHHGSHHRMFMGGHHGGKGGFLGVHMSELTPELRTHFGVPDDAGVMVSKVVDDSPASRIGVQVGDIISAVDGDIVSSSHGLAKAISAREGGETVNLEVWRDGSVLTLSPAVEEREGHGRRTLEILCGDGEDCDLDFDFDFDHDFDFDCGDKQCNVEVECEDGDCECRINGEAADCSAIHGLHSDD